MGSARNTGPGIAAAFSALLWLYLVTGAQPTQMGPWLGLLLLAMTLEVTAARLPAWGLISVAPGAYLAAALHPRLGLPVIGCAAVVGLVLRGLVRPRERHRETLSESLADLLPLLMWLSALEFFQVWNLGWLVASLLFLILQLGCARWLSPLEGPGFGARIRAVPFLTGALLLGGLAGKLHAQSGVVSAVALALLLFGYGVAMVVRVEESVENRRLQVRLFHQRRQREALELELSRLEKGGQAQTEAHRVLRSTLAALERASSTQEALNRLLDLIQETVPCQRISALLPTDRGLEVLAGANPPLANEVQSLCRRAWRENRPLSGRTGKDFHTALPLRGYAVAYLTRPTSFESEERTKLWLMARHGAVMISKIAEKETSERALAFVSEERRLLSRWVHRLNQLLEGARHLFAASGVEEVLKLARECLESLVPHERYLCLEVDRQPQPEWDSKAIAGLVEEIKKRGAPVFLSGRNHPMGSEFPSLMAMLLQTKPARLLMVADSLPDAFQKEERDLFCLLGSMTETSLNRLRLTADKREAAKMAAVGQIAAGLSHELNTPLGAVQLAIESAQQFLPTQPEKAEARLEGAREAFSRASEILEGLLFYATSYAVHEPEELPLVEILREVTESLGGVFACDGAPTGFRGHRLDLEHMIRQLLRNAQQADSQNFGLRVKAQGENTIIQVWDRGSGVDAGIRDRVFEPFFSGRETGEGLGLGLSVSRRIAELHGGTLRLLEGGQGAVFEVILPTRSSA